jgi:cystathionine beta-lyase
LVNAEQDRFILGEISGSLIEKGETTMRYDFDHVPNRRPTDSVKWNKHEADVLPLWVADMDYPVAEPILQVLRGRIEHGIFGYPDVHPKPDTISDLQQVLVDRMQRLYNWQVAPEELLLLPGVIVGLNLTCHMLATPGGGVLIQTPVYPPFFQTAPNSGMVLQEASLLRRPDGGYEVDWEAFEAAFTDRTRVFILCNPHNPVGRVFRKDELEHIADICLRRGVRICSDEIHCDLLFKGQKHTPIASLDKEIAQNTVTLMSPTKTFNIAGLQCSFAIVQNKELRKKLEQTMKGLVMWVNLIGLTATLAAYREGQEWLDQVRVYLEGNRNYLFDVIQSRLPGIKMAKPEGTYLAWLDCRKSGIPGNPCEFFLKEARLAFNDGVSFGRGGEGFVRLNFASTRATLTQALERMRVAMEKVSG